MVREQPRHSNRPKGIKTCLDSHKFSLIILDSLLITRYLFKTSDTLFLVYFIEVELIYDVLILLYNSDSVLHIYPFFFIFFSIMVNHRILNIVPCAITEGPCLLNSNSHSHPIPHGTPLGNHQSFLCF